MLKIKNLMLKFVKHINLQERVEEELRMIQALSGISTLKIEI